MRSIVLAGCLYATLVVTTNLTDTAVSAAQPLDISDIFGDVEEGASFAPDTIQRNTQAVAATDAQERRKKRRRPTPTRRGGKSSKPFVPLKPLTPEERLAITRPVLWTPEIAAPFQIILTGVVDTAAARLTPEHVAIFDIDMFLTPKSSIDDLRTQNKKVICYFSAGSSEDWRDDYGRLTAKDMGNKVEKDDAGKSFWDGEKWLNIKNPNPSDTQNLPNVWQLMRDRIRFAAQQGCDAIDPDNVDGFENKNGLKLTKADSVQFIKFMADEARQFNMSTGLKNTMDLLPSVGQYVQFAVNEECATRRECGKYKDFLRTKPVFHIEYTKIKSRAKAEPVAKSNAKGTSRKVTKACLFRTSPDWGPLYSTVLKVEALDGWVQFCDGTAHSTRLVRGSTGASSRLGDLEIVGST